MSAMLRLVSRLALWLSVLWLGLAGLGVYLGRSAPLEDGGSDQLGFATCALPCWAGIIPGRTPFAEARQLLEQNVPALYSHMEISDSQLNFWAGTPEQQVSGLLRNGEAHVSDIRLNITLPMWYLLSSLGAPDCVWVGYTPRGQQRQIAVYWEEDGLSTITLLLADSDRVSWTPYTPMQTLWVRPGEGNCSGAGLLPWQGFAPIWRYERLVRAETTP